MEERQVAALIEMTHAVNAGDASRYARLYAQDAVITIHGSDVLEGRVAIESHEIELLREFPDVRLGFHDVWLNGPSAVVHYAVSGRTPGGRSMGHEGLLFYRFHRSGLIAEEGRYLDSLTPMAQLGILGALSTRPLPTVPNEPTVHAAKCSASEEENVARVRESFAALDSKVEKSFLSRMAQDVVLDEMTETQAFVGQYTVRSWFRSWTAAVSDPQSEITTIFGVGEYALAEIAVRGTLEGPLGRISATHQEFVVHRASIVQVRDGAFVRISNFMNGKELAQAVGQWPPRMTTDRLG